MVRWGAWTSLRYQKGRRPEVWAEGVCQAMGTTQSHKLINTDVLTNRERAFIMGGKEFCSRAAVGSIMPGGRIPANGGREGNPTGTK